MSSLAEILSAFAVPSSGGNDATPRCSRCGALPVRRHGDLCAGCTLAARTDWRSAALRVARESIPPVFRELDACEVRRRVRVPPETVEHAWAATTRGRVVLVGAAGFGKTTLACWMLRRVIDAGPQGTREEFERARGARFVDAPRLCRAVREHPLGEGEAPLLCAAHQATVLVLDDVGQELDARMAANPVVDVIRERHASGRTTWVTTFLAPQAFERAYGSGTARRVLDGAAVIAVGIAS